MFFEHEPKFAKCYKVESKPHKFCPGCGHGLILKSLGDAIDDLKISSKVLLSIDIGCSLLAWDFFNLNTIQAHHGRAIPIASGYKVASDDKIAICYVGDGGAYAIGLQSLITAAIRNDPVVVIVVNNTLYGMTGGQMAPTTLEEEITTTTPDGKKSPPFYGPELVKKAGGKNIFVARGTVGNPVALKGLLRSAIKNNMDNNNFNFLEILSMCPVNWKKDAKESLHFLEKDMQKIFNLGEIK